MAHSITHAKAARGQHDAIKDACESLMRGDERPIATNDLTIEQRLELFRMAKEIVLFYSRQMEFKGRAPEYADYEVFRKSRQYAKSLAMMLRRQQKQISTSARSELIDWFETDRKLPRVAIEYV